MIGCDCIREVVQTRECFTQWIYRFLQIIEISYLKTGTKYYV